MADHDDPSLAVLLTRLHFLLREPIDFLKPWLGHPRHSLAGLVV
jgi:hypothetical protein